MNKHFEIHCIDGSVWATDAIDLQFTFICFIPTETFASHIRFTIPMSQIRRIEENLRPEPQVAGTGGSSPADSTKTS